MPKIAFHTLGCKLNFSETSTLARQFKAAGYDCIDFEGVADIFVLNTCSVTENADQKCRRIIRAVKKRAPESYVAVVGCYAQLQAEQLAQIEGVNLVLGAKEKFNLVDQIEAHKSEYEPLVVRTAIEKNSPFHGSFSLDDRTRTFLKVQDGCNYNCSFCTIPLARGSSRSQAINEILKQVEKIVQNGVREIVLTGVNIGDYGIIEGKRRSNFLELLKALDEVPGIERFRISSIEPNLLSNAIIDFVAASDKFVPHFHMPLQSGQDKVLKAMRRRYDTNLFRRRVESIKAKLPEAAIGIDVIVGFPTESQAYFEDTYNFLNSLPCSYLHVFTYSERPNTPAYQLDQIPYRVRKARANQLRNLSKLKKQAFYQTQIGQVLPVLFEKENRAGAILGFSANYVRVRTAYKTDLANQIVNFRVTDFYDEDSMVGEVVG